MSIVGNNQFYIYFYSLILMEQCENSSGNVVCICSGQDNGVGQLFRVRDADLRARVALHCLERWPLSACLELLDFCLSDTNTEASLRAAVEQKKKELDIYRSVINIEVCVCAMK